jgi:predicted DNA-binding transcriptional regulator YafY
LKERGIHCDRRTLYSDIDMLETCGYQIIKIRAKSNKYYIVNSDFDIPELKILIDAVHAASFITEKKSRELIDKIAALAGGHRAELLKQDMVCFDTVKHTNEKIFYYIDAINNCILKKKQVSFLYFDYGVNGERIYRKDEKRYVVNPISLVFSADNYYLVCYSDKYQNISNYRVDRMDDVREEAADITDAPCKYQYDKNKFRKQAFSMFTGELTEVTLVADNELTNVIIDKFGEKIKMTPCGGNCFKINVKV